MVDVESQMRIVDNIGAPKKPNVLDRITEIIYTWSPAVAYRWVGDYEKYAKGEDLSTLSLVSAYWADKLKAAGYPDAGDELTRHKTKDAWLTCFNEIVMPVLIGPKRVV